MIAFVFLGLLRTHDKEGLTQTPVVGSGFYTLSGGVPRISHKLPSRPGVARQAHGIFRLPKLGSRFLGRVRRERDRHEETRKS
jgi:hypothetical protein